MRESFLQLAQKSPAELVDEAARIANDLATREMRGPGDLPNAMERLERRYALPTRSFWSLRYRKPKSICASLLLKLLAAYQAEIERQMRHLNHELAITEAIAGAAPDSVRSARALVDAHHA